MHNFPCARCGVCCRSLKLNELFVDLDRGDGVCIHLDEETNLCHIYETRPLKCNIDKSYYKLYINYFSKDDFYKVNIEACKLLKKGE